jgi:hypothetical protein
MATKKKTKALKKPKKLAATKPLRANFQPQPTPYHSQGDGQHELSRGLITARKYPTLRFLKGGVFRFHVIEAVSTPGQRIG